MDSVELINAKTLQNMRDERRETYLKSLAAPFPEALETLRQQAKTADIPLLREDTVRFLRFLLTVKKPKRILEIGTATGSSAVLLAMYGSENCHVDTIESLPERAEAARKNLENIGLSERVTVYEGDALTVLPALTGTYEFVLIDAAKGQYPAYLTAVKPLLSKEAVIAADNVLQEEEILESRYLIEHRNRTIHKRLRMFLTEAMRDEGFVGDILPIGDGLLLLAKR